MQDAAVLLATGFEEIEAVSVIDVLRRAELEVAVVSISGSEWVEGAHGLRLAADCVLASLDPLEPTLVVLPGGMPGATNLAADAAVLDLLRRRHAAAAWIGAICAAPIVLQAAGILRGRRVTCYPGFETQLAGAHCTGQTVERDGHIVTSRGPGTALLFALELVRLLGRADAADALRKGMLLDAGRG